MSKDDWLVATMDLGVVGSGFATKKEAMAYAVKGTGSLILSSRRFEAGGYELILGFPDEDHRNTFYVMRPEVARRQGIKESMLEENCHYCGRSLDQPIKRRMEQGVFYELHGACATKWDNEKRRM